MNRYILIAIVPVLIVLLAAAFAEVNKLGAIVTGRTPSVTIVQAYQGSSQSNVIAEGTIVPEHTINVSLLPGMAGEVTQVPVDIGSYVHQGQLLAEIDPSGQQDDLAAAQAQVQTATEQYALVKVPYQPEQIEAKRLAVASDLQAIDQAKNKLTLVLAGNRPQQIQEAQAEADSAKASSVQAQADLKREIALYAKDLIPKAELEASQTLADVDKDTLYKAQQQLSLMQEGNLPEEIQIARADLERAQMTYKSDLGLYQMMLRGSRPEEIAEAADQVRVAEFKADQQSLNYSHRFVYSPTSGVIIARNVNPGEYVTPESSHTSSTMPLISNVKSLFTIADDKSTVFEANVDQMYYKSMHRGQVADVSVEAYPGRSFDAVLTDINPLIYPNSIHQSGNTISPSTPLTFTVIAKISDPTHVLVPGQIGLITLDNKQNGLVIPQSAVTSFTLGEGSVYVESNGIVMPRAIRYDGNLDGTVRVLSGLSAGESVVVSDTSLLTSGMHVKAVTATSDDMTAKAF